MNGSGQSLRSHLGARIALGFIQKDGWTLAQRRRNLHQKLERRVFLPTLDAGKIASREACLMGKLFLTQPLGFPQTADVRPNNFLPAHTAWGTLRQVARQEPFCLFNLLATRNRQNSSSCPSGGSIICGK